MYIGYPVQLNPLKPEAVEEDWECLAILLNWYNQSRSGKLQMDHLTNPFTPRHKQKCFSQSLFFINSTVLGLMAKAYMNNKLK